MDRRAAITKAETLKAERNKATEEIAKLKKDKQDATAQINQTKDLREKLSPQPRKLPKKPTRDCATSC